MTTTTSNPLVIEMDRVAVSSFQDPERAVIEDVTWSVGAGEYWVVAGLHAAGKSDLISMTGGLMPPLRGSYRLLGREMPIFGDELIEQRLRLGVVFDSGRLLHQLNVRDNIALPLRYHRDLEWQEIEDRVKRMLELTELTPHAETMPGRLERHWQKRAGLARALMLGPEVLLVDNPLGGLDFRQAKWCLDFLDQLSAGHGLAGGRPITLVVTAGDLRPWRNPACRFALLKEQRFITLGRQQDLSGHDEPLVKELLAEEISITH